MERDSKELAVVLKVEPKGDVSKLVTLLSADSGVFTAVLYGARKSAKALKVPLYSEGSFSLYRVRERNQCSVKDVDYISLRENILGDFPSLMIGSLISELTITSRMNGAGIYSLVAKCLDELEFGSSPKRVAIYFIINYLELFGTLSSLDFCPVCQKRYADGEILGYSIKEGTLCCMDCDEHDRNLILPPNARAFLIRNLELPLADALSLEISDMMIGRIYSFLLRFLRLSYPMRLKSLDSGMLETV